ncbi:MAG: sulfurtransferase [Acidobacteria bacterium]|nr:sulfurtransferase [Acidobacteriota bacterium]
MSDYAHPEMLVSTEWVAAHSQDPDVRLVEVDVDTKAYDQGHAPNAIAWAWKTQLCDTIQRDVLSKAQFEELMSSSGVAPDTTLVLYGDENNWFAAWALWLAVLRGHRDVRLMNGGRRKWLLEGRELSMDRPGPARTEYQASGSDLSVRAYFLQVLTAAFGGKCALVDTRSPAEFTGEILAPPGLPETCQRGGHIPGARSIPWELACNPDGTFKSYAELKALYEAEGVDGSKPVVTYCRIGERSSHSWFVLKYLLGYPGAANYDGSWTEWGNLVGVPVERGAGQYAERQVVIRGWSCRLSSFRLGDRYHAEALNVAAGAVLARSVGASREEAEREALQRAEESLAIS